MGKIIIRYGPSCWDVVFEEGKGKSRRVIHREAFSQKTHEERAAAIGERLEQIRAHLAQPAFKPS